MTGKSNRQARRTSKPSQSARTPFCPSVPLSQAVALDSRLVSDEELSNPEFVRAVRAKALNLQIPACLWHDHLVDLYRDLSGVILGSDGSEAYLDMDVFERENIHLWFREFCCRPCPEFVAPRVRAEARERVRILASVLRASYPIEARYWGCVANDNLPKM